MPKSNASNAPKPVPMRPARALGTALLYLVAGLAMIPLVLAGLTGAVYLIILSVRTFGAVGLVYVIVGGTLAVVFGSIYHGLRRPASPTIAGRRSSSGSSSSRSTSRGGRGRWLALGFFLGRRQ